MENQVFEKCYHKEQDTSDSGAILEQLISGGVLKNISKAMKAVPKVIVPEYKANYEYTLRLCDDLAKQYNGSVRGIVNYEHWEATIDLVIPFVEFASTESLQILRDIAEKSHSVTIMPVDGNISIRIFNLYFEDLISDDAKNYMIYDQILTDKKLAGMLGVSDELPPDLEALAEKLNDLLDTLQEATGKDRTKLFKELLLRVSKIMYDFDNPFDALDQVTQDMIDEKNTE